MAPQCFACSRISPAYRFAGRLICGDCAGDGGVIYHEPRPGLFVLAFARRELYRHLLTFSAGDLPSSLIGSLARLHKLRLDGVLERITRGEERLVHQVGGRRTWRTASRRA